MYNCAQKLKKINYKLYLVELQQINQSFRAKKNMLKCKKVKSKLF